MLATIDKKQRVMIKDMLVSFTENLKTKSTNPFFGTLILVWLTNNWNLIYSLFNFDNEVTLPQKREFIVTYFSKNPLINGLLQCIIETFVLIVISYFLVNLARLIINLYEKRLTPLVYKWTDEKSIILKSVFDISEKERQRLEKKLDEEREAKLKLQEDYEKLERKNSDLILRLEEKLKDEVEGSEEKTKSTIDKNLKEKQYLIFNKLEKESKIKEFENIASDILNNESINKNNKLIHEFTTLGLIKQSSHYTQDYYYYQLTQLGSDIHEIILLNDMK